MTIGRETISRHTKAATAKSDPQSCMPERYSEQRGIYSLKAMDSLERPQSSTLNLNPKEPARDIRP